MVKGSNQQQHQDQDQELRLYNVYADACMMQFNFILEFNLHIPLFQLLYYYTRNFCNLIGVEQWYFSLI